MSVVDRGHSTALLPSSRFENWLECHMHVALQSAITSPHRLHSLKKVRVSRMHSRSYCSLPLDSDSQHVVVALLIRFWCTPHGSIAINASACFACSWYYSTYFWAVDWDEDHVFTSLRSPIWEKNIIKRIVRRLVCRWHVYRVSFVVLGRKTDPIPTVECRCFQS